MSLDTTQIDKITDFISRAKESIKDEDAKATFRDIDVYIKNAKEAMADNEEKCAYLLDAVTRWANQIVFMLFRENNLPEDIKEEFFTFTPVAETTAKARKFIDARQAKIDEINEARAKVTEEQRGLDIFQAIIGGMSKEEAKAKLEEYDQKIAQAQG